MAVAFLLALSEAVELNCAVGHCTATVCSVSTGVTYLFCVDFGQTNLC